LIGSRVSRVQANSRPTSDATTTSAATDVVTTVTLALRSLAAETTTSGLPFGVTTDSEPAPAPSGGIYQCAVFLHFMHNHAASKTNLLHYSSYFCQTVINVLNPVELGKKFAAELLLQFFPHLADVAALPCKILFFKILPTLHAHRLATIW